MKQDSKKAYRFDLFKGEVDKNGKVRKLRTVGAAILVERNRTHTP